MKSFKLQNILDAERQRDHVNVPIKEGELGRPVMVTNGYHVGPYFGVADRVGVDWYNGGVSWNRGVASPFVGVGVNSGTSIGFPSIGSIMSRIGVSDMNQLSKILTAKASTRENSAISRMKRQSLTNGAKPHAGCAITQSASPLPSVDNRNI
ncbi:hypothetical protein DICVIV_08487 [Dictyocaulus viviparus]|uniref:Uncharacterized protein n=1 Tax=Dictyocaulus viviparus TaxID=29172 RepID=A0A0D8XNV4_DICVI|nr:hypothetical protein DICVIV_08487 [Dictyocaulus viviparus]